MYEVAQVLAWGAVGIVLIQNLGKLAALHMAAKSTDDLSKNIATLIERQQVLEKAMTNALKQMTEVVGYSEEKHKQLVARTVVKR